MELKSLKLERKLKSLKLEQDSHLDLGIATSLLHVGNVLLQMGKPEEALVKHQEGLEIKLKLLGSEHPRVADSLMGKGCCLGEMGKYEEALVEYLKSLDIKTRNPDNHLDVAEIRENMAIIIGNKATTTKPLKSTSLFWKSRSAYTVKTPWMWRTRSTTWLRCTSVRETTYRQKRWPLRHTIHSLRC